MTARSSSGCIVCDARGGRATPPAKTSRVTVRGRTIVLCSAHAGQVAIKMPKTWDELRAVFATGVERRSPIPRRAPEREDRRVFPPRPEGRRKGSGRRGGEAGQ